MSIERNREKPKANIDFLVTEQTGLLDFLLKTLKGKSRNNVKSLLSGRAVAVNGKVVTQFDMLLKAGQTVRIIPQTELLQKKSKLIKVIYEDEDFIVIDKPAGLLSISTDKEKEKTAYHLLTDHIRIKNPKARIFSVHRLDRDTSGVLIAAKNERLKLALQDNWDDLVAYRGYAAVVEGTLTEKRGRLKSWIKETKTHLMYSSGRAGDGQEAVTNYEVLKESGEYSLLNIWLETGRKNQIRVHMKDLGHSVTGDKKYGASADPLKRLALHAYKLELRHPFTGELMRFETDIPQKFLSLFRSNG
jgi:23S rRNA pseudouridine1911/1915/1917 synthase